MKISKVLLSLFVVTIISLTISVSSSEAFLPENLPDVSQAPSHVRVIEGDNLVAYARPLYTSLDNPSNHEVPTSASHDGVAKLVLYGSGPLPWGCSGTLADDKVHVFTAAHCVADNNGNHVLTAGTATFEGNSESITISIDPVNSLAHPDYDGDYIKGNDIAVLKLTSTAPSQIPGIPHATSGSVIDTEVNKSGYGLSGYLNSGTNDSVYPFGIERSGKNTYDAFADTMYLALQLIPNEEFIPGAIYQFDSDDGTSKHDAFGFFFGMSDTGLGNNEVLSAPGDSGGPAFANGELVGITSYGITLQYTNKQTSDCTTQFRQVVLDSSCGEFAGDTRVASYADWIDSVLTPIIDLDSPVITAINSDASSTTATITWTTDEPSTSSVDYGADTTYGSSVSDGNYVTSHSVELIGLSSSSVYHFSVTSTDSSNNSASSDDAQFATASPLTLVSISVSPVTPSITEGTTQQFTATGTYSDNSNQILSDVTWSSSSTDIATIDVDGLATGILAGTTTITAVSGGQQDSAVLDVTSLPTGLDSQIEFDVDAKKRFNNLLLTIVASDGTTPVSNVSVDVTLSRVGDSWNFSGITDESGSVTFKLMKSRSNVDYTATITNWSSVFVSGEINDCRYIDDDNALQSCQP